MDLLIIVDQLHLNNCQWNSVTFKKICEITVSSRQSMELLWTPQSFSRIPDGQDHPKTGFQKPILGLWKYDTESNISSCFRLHFYDG